MGDWIPYEETEPEQTNAGGKRKRVEEDEYSDEENPLAPHLPEEVLSDAAQRKADMVQQVKKLKLMHPDIDLGYLREMDQELKQKNLRELNEEYENLKLAIGLEKPGENSVGVVGAIGMAVGRLLGQHDLHQKLVKNPEVLTAFEAMCPPVLQYFSAPVKLAYLVGQSIYEEVEKKPSISPS